LTTPFTKTRAFTPVIVSAAFIAIVAAAHWLRSPLYYPQVIVEAQQGLRLEFLQQGLTKKEDCEAATRTIAGSVRASCPVCRIAAQQCLGGPAAEHEQRLSEAPIGLPSSRIPHGVVTYVSRDKDLALDACRKAPWAGSTQGQGFLCAAPNSPRQMPGAQRIGNAQLGTGLLLLLVSAIAAALAGYLIVRYEALHARWSHDPVHAAPQKFHATPTPRIGGLAVVAGLLASGIALIASRQGGSYEPYGYLLLAGVPAFLGGIAEDLTKRVSVAARLLLTMLAAAFGVWLLGGVIPRLDVPGLDWLLMWSPFAIAVTAFAVGGVANSINIIDGYNGLASGHAVIVLAAMAWVSALLGDAFLLISALAMIGALLGFFAWNYPGGKMFLGDGGAYLLGFWLGELSVLMVVRHPEVSPWFPMLLLVYPIFETVYSIYRRKVLEGLSPGQPDRMHLHQVIYMHLTRGASTDVVDPATLIRWNSLVAPFSWAMTLCCALPALLLWRQTGWLVAAALIFCLGYLLLYRQLLKRIKLL